MKEYAHIYYPVDGTIIKGLSMMPNVAFDAHYFNLVEPFSKFVVDKGQQGVTKEILQSALYESLDRTKLVSIYNDLVLSPDENRLASEISRYLDEFSYGFLTANIPAGQNGLIDVHMVKMTSAYGAVLIQRLDNA